MKATTKKISEGEYAVLIDGNTTALRVVKGAPPKYRERQEWGIVGADGHHLVGDQPGKFAALQTIQAILDAANRWGANP